MKVQPLTTADEIARSTQHEIAHYQAALQLAESSKHPQFRDQVAAHLGVRLIRDSVTQVRFQPVNLVNFGDGLSADEQLYAQIVITAAPFYIAEDHNELSAQDLHQLRVCQQQISSATPLAQTLLYELAGILDPGLYDHRQQMMWNE